MAAKLTFKNPAIMHKPPGYTHVVEATAPARIIYIAGQLGVGVDGQLVGRPGDFRAQAVQTFENLKAALAAAGATFDDVVKTNNYLIDMAHLPIFRDVRDRYIDTKWPPASTAVQISGLARDGALLEVEAVAIIPGRAATAAKPAAKRKTAKKAKTAKKGTKKGRAKRR